MRRSEAAIKAAKDRLGLELLISDYADEHDMSDVELLQALNSSAQTTLKYMLRAERHPDDPDKPADIE